MQRLFNFKEKRFAVYGLGLTGKSVVKFLKKNKANKIFIWDDYSIKSNLKLKTKFKLNLDFVDYIIISPGINIRKSNFKNKLLKNKKKIITDLDLFFLKYRVKKSVIVTGTNGKSTTCSLIHHVLKKNRIKNKIAGNIGRPILDLKFIKNEIYIIEASSFQLEYSKFIKPYCAAILNISQDHLEWHGSKKKYVMSKIKIFNNQTKK
jgi:UDP-N-acetylmuramoylalanine-D-glutamate ligase